MSKSCLIISGGEYDPVDLKTEYDCIIACDRGYEYSLRMGIEPDILIGDFDSYTGPLPEDREIIMLPVHKDDTDTGYAAKYALEKGYDRITIICALGGRFDHTFANIQTLCHLAENGVTVDIPGSNTVIHAACSSSVIIPERPGWSFSVFSFTDTCSGVSISGAEYSVSDITLVNTFPIGESNSWAADSATVSCREGILLVIESKS